MAEEKRQNERAPTLRKEFYFANAFAIEGEAKANAMRFAAQNNLTPFRDLLQNLLNNNDKLMKVSANVYPVDAVVKLIPEFCIVKPALGKETKYSMPTDNYYFLEWEDDYGDVADFIEIIDRRRTFVLDATSKVDYFEGCIFFKSDNEPPKSLTLYYGEDEKSIFCEIEKLNFERDFGKYRVSASKEIKSLCCKDNSIVVQDISDEKIVLFDCIDLIRIGETHSIDASKLITEKDNKVRLLDSGHCIIYCDEVIKLYYDGEPVQFSRVSEKEYSLLLHDNNILFKGKTLTLSDEVTETEGHYASNFGAVFTCQTGQFKATTRYKEGVFVMIEDDGSYHSELLSSTSFFFREDIEELTDIERSQTNKSGGRTFEIGRRLEEESIIEIVEKVNGRRQKVKELPSKLFIVSKPFQLRMQLNAVNVLINEPAPHHKALLQLMDKKFYWGEIDTSSCNIGDNEWFRLTDKNYDGVEEQRNFVKLALCTKDFAFLEGPPGSGKTTTILEIIAQMIDRRERVMLAASTNAAIDNILERLEKLPQHIRNKILAVRIGNDGSVCETVDHYRPDNIKDDNLAKVIKERANLVCGTTFGVLKHPEFNLSSRKKGEMVPPLFDCLIVDEASKTTFQDFLVPAIYAKKWILSGDINQLTPYIEKEDIASLIRYMKDFDERLQDVQGIIQQLTIDNKLEKLRFCIPVGQQYLNAVVKLAPPELPFLCIGDFDNGIGLSLESILSGGESSYKLYGARYIFVREDYFDRVQSLLPSDVIVLRKDESEARQSYYSNDFFFENKVHKFKGVSLCGGRGQTNYSKVADIRKALTGLFSSKDWSGEIAWRVARQQELFLLQRIDKENGDKVKQIERDIQARVPKEYQGLINNFFSLIRELSLPSILQLLKQGISESLISKKYKTTLNSGFEEKDYKSRSALLQYQGRMHGDISKFSREFIYNNEALQDSRIQDRKWGYSSKRSIWIDVENEKKCDNENSREIDAIVKGIKEFAKYAEVNPKRQDPEDAGCFSIAILTYYKKQEANIKRAIAKLTDSTNQNRSVYRWVGKNIKIEIYSVDKYQGKEADIVFISMVKSGGAGLGFMDSPNRLNVALTRAKFLRVIVGSRRYFKTSRNYLLKKLEGSVL